MGQIKNNSNNNIDDGGVDCSGSGNDHNHDQDNDDDDKTSRLAHTRESFSC